MPSECSQAVLSSLPDVQIKIFEVTEEELDRQRKGFANGLIAIKIEETTFSMKWACTVDLPLIAYLWGLRACLSGCRQLWELCCACAAVCFHSAGRSKLV